VDFESTASTNFATVARCATIPNCASATMRSCPNVYVGPAGLPPRGELMAYRTLVLRTGNDSGPAFA
jgi:hypothetical protein